MRMLSARLAAHALWLGAVSFSVACAPSESESGASADQVTLEAQDLSTPLTQLRVGQPFIPGVEESLVEVGRPCVDGVETVTTNGLVTSTATVVRDRQTLNRELGLNAPDDPKKPATFTVPSAGLSGTAQLSSTTQFDRQSSVILMQAAGTYSSVLTKTASLPTFSPSDVSRCGYGFVAAANHRVSAALLVTVRSNDGSSNTNASANLEGNDLPTMNAHLTNILMRGNLEVSLHYVTDLIPNLPPPPIQQAVIVVGDKDSEKKQALDKLNEALNWLGKAHESIQNYIADVQKNPAATQAAPTQSLRFRYYPTTPKDVRQALATANANAMTTRANLVEANRMVDSWTRFSSEVDKGAGYAWNIPAAPLGSLDELTAKKRELMDSGKLPSYRDALDSGLDDCTQALRNDEGATSVTQAMATKCVPPAALPFDKSTNDLHELVTENVFESTNAHGACPAGSRRPYEGEAKVFGPWSHFLAQSGKGIWLEKSGCTFSKGWIYDGAPGCTPFARPRTGATICIDAAKGAMP